jgi:hypothetical protein
MTSDLQLTSKRNMPSTAPGQLGVRACRQRNAAKDQHEADNMK